ncbi:hypothetical protein J3R82DRAFT_4172 [Butyriboletus roseoflavus]|nr:hypothetical protein J3R82DRAFT_4172 [Butyriboletus roseoflavus]
MARPLPTDFFVRQCKGKEKAVEPPAVQCNQCWLPPSHPMSTSSCISRHSPWCPSTPSPSYRRLPRLTFLFLVRNRLFMMNEVIPCRSQPFPQPSQRCARRHASSAARILSSHTLDRPQAVFLSHEPEDPADKLRSLLVPRTPFDPEHAWHLYMASVHADANSPMLTPGEQLQFIQRMLDAFELCGDAPPDLPLLHTWGTRLEPVLRGLRSDLEGGSISLKCFTAQVHAWLGDVAQAAQLAREIREDWLTYADRCTLLCVYRNILVLSRYQQGASYALDLLIREWKFLGTFCHTRTIPFPQAASFRKAIHNLLVDIPDGAGLLHSRSRTDQDDRSRMGELLLETYFAKELTSPGTCPST